MADVVRALFIVPCLALLPFAAACGGTTSAKSAADDPAGGAVSPTPRAALPPLEPAPAPRSLVVKLRVRDVTKLIDGSLEAAGIPMTSADGLDRLLRDDRALALPRPRIVVHGVRRR